MFCGVGGVQRVDMGGLMTINGYYYPSLSGECRYGSTLAKTEVVDKFCWYFNHRALGGIYVWPKKIPVLMVSPWGLLRINV